MAFGRLGLGLGLRAGGKRNAAPTDISLTAATVAEDAVLGAVIGTLSATDPENEIVTFSLTDDASGRFGVDGTDLIVTGVLDFETATSHSITVRATDEHGAAYDEVFAITVTDVSETPPDDPLPDDGDIEDDGTFTNPPVVVNVDGGVKLAGKKAGGSVGKFIYDLGAANAGRTYTVKYDPDFTLLTNTGKNAAVGFVIKQGNDFHFVGLRGDGSTGLDAVQIYGDGLWNSGTGFTEVDGGDALHGTQAGPNWIQMQVSGDGETYTFRTSSDGETWSDEFTAVDPNPHADVDGPAQFGIGAIFGSNDTGSFSILVEVYRRLWLPSDLGANLLLWLKGDDLSGSDGSNIAAWNDASGNARNFTQATEADKPNLEVAELNGLNVVRFTRSNTEFLTGASLSGVATAGSLFQVVKAVTDPGGGGDGGPSHFGSHTTTNHYTFTDGSIYNGDMSTARKTVGNPTPNTTAWNISGVTSASADWKYYLNGTQIFTTATNTVGFSTSPELGRTNGVTVWDGFMAEVVLVSGVISQANREKVEGYLAHKWGITSVLDAAHPYKSSAPTI